MAIVLAKVTRGRSITEALITGNPPTRIQQALTIERRLRAVEAFAESVTGSMGTGSGAVGGGIFDPDGGGIFDPDPPPAVAPAGSRGSNGYFSQGDHTHRGVTSISAVVAASGPVVFDGDVLQAGNTFTWATFVDAEVVTFTGATATLANTPSPASSLMLFNRFPTADASTSGWSLLCEGAGEQYTISGAVITLTAAAPIAGAVYRAWYRYY